MNNAILFTNARVVCPKSNFDGAKEVLVENGVISEIGDNIDAPDNCEIIDCDGHALLPGLIDMRVTTGEPGAEHRETMLSAARAAVASGITSMVLTPDTSPVIDDAAMVDFIKRRGRDYGLAKIYPAGAATKNLNGNELSEIGLMSEAGAIIFSNGDKEIENTSVMKRLLSYSTAFDALIQTRPQDIYLSKNGVMAEGELAARLGLRGISAGAETIIVNRDITLAAMSGGKLLLDMISSRESLPLIEKAKLNGLDVFASVNIHNLTMNENDIGDYRTFAKLNPPLRKEADRLALITAVKSGIIDIIVSGHNPRPPEEKRLPFDEASFGAGGLEILLKAALTLYHDGSLSLLELLRPLTQNPAAILGLAQGRIEKDAPADLILVDLGYPNAFELENLYSKSKNYAFEGRLLQGKVLSTFVDGKKVFDAEIGHLV